jgi:hypothetical protein
LSGLIDWAAAEGWNPGLEDAAMFQAADQEGFIGAFVGDDMVAAISAVAYGQDFGFIGLYICRPDMRGKGYGKAVWTAGMDRLAGRTIGLDGVQEQQANYRSKRFMPVYETIRYSGRPASLPAAAERPRIVTAQPVPDIIAYDALCFPAPRRSFLQRWLLPPHHAVAAITSRGTAGYAVARACRSGFKIGPLFADNVQTALELLGELAGACEGGELNIDVPTTQVDFIAALEAAGFSPTFSTTRMYRGSPPKLDAKRVFGVTTLELG